MIDNDQNVDLAIVGAGAAGLFVALFAGREAGDRATIVALDGAAKVGAKILVAGGGRCNVTHDVVRVEDYAGGAGTSRNAVKKVLKSFPVERTVGLFEELGVTLKREETGKLFPTTDRARTVLDGILAGVAAAGVEVRTGCRVKGIEHIDEGFHIETSQGPLMASRVVLATGGMALPKTGSDGFGYTLARRLGHSVTATHPALVPLILSQNHWLTGLSGVSFPAELTLASPTGKTLHTQQGSLLLTHFGLSGPAAMDVSRHWLAAQPPLGEGGELRLSLLPGSRFEEVEAAMLRSVSVTPRARLVDVLQRLAPEPPARLREALLREELALDPTTPIAQLPRDARRSLAHAVTGLPLPVVGDRGYTFAECTAGGVPLDEVDIKTMHSRHCDGLYLCGELLDVDGRIGGYNFQWAWATGRLAGLAAGADVGQEA